MEISKFREFVILNHDVLKQYLEDSNGKSLTPILSSLDWFETSVHFFREFKLESNVSQDVYSFLCYAKVSAIDNIVESVIQLKKTLKISKLTAAKRTVFLSSLDIFADNELKSKTDYEYFKDIRAIFGAHTVDINLKIDNKQFKYFAQWTSKIAGNDADITGFIHSPDDGANDIRIDLYFNILDKIIEKAETELDIIVGLLKETEELKEKLDVQCLV